MRGAISRLGTTLSRLVLRTEVKDLMSGFFMLRRDIVEEAAPRLCPSGFKILADILASSPAPRAVTSPKARACLARSYRSH